jgi:hypothetical protein
MGEKRSACRYWWEREREGNHYEDQYVTGWMDLGETVWGVLSGLVWLRMLGNYRVAAQPVALE